MRYIGETSIPRVVSVAEFKRSIKVIASDVVDDAEFEALLDAAQDAVVTASNLPPASGAYEAEFEIGTGLSRWWFPCRPVTAITGVAVNDVAGAWQDQTLTGVRLLRPHDEPQVLIAADWPGFRVEGADSIRVQFTAGAALPPRAGQAMKLLAKEWHEAQIAIAGEAPAPRLSMGALRLIRSIRYMRPRVSAGW